MTGTPFDQFTVRSVLAWLDSLLFDDKSQAADEDRVSQVTYATLAAFILGAGGAETATLAGAKTIADTDGSVFYLNPNGAHRDVNLPAEAVTNKLIVLVNTAGAAFNLVAKSDAPATIITVGQNQIGILWSNGTVWRGAVIAATSGSGDMATTTYDPATIAEQLVGLTAAQTLTNKTLTSPKINEDVVLTPTATELNYVDGVTSAIQPQLNDKAPVASPTFTGTVTLPVGLTGVVRVDSGVVAVDSDVTDIVGAASESAAGKVELATTAEVVTGTDTARAVTPAGDKAALDNEISVARTLTNKTLIASTNVIEEKTTVASDTTPNPTGGSLRNKLTVTALAGAAELQAPSGTPQDGHVLIVRWKDDGTARALTYNAIYRGIGITPATTTVISKTLYQMFMYNSAATKWDLLAQGQEA